MSKKCIGCGIKIQSQYPESLGYSPKENAKYCERCFRINNYNEAKFVDLPLVQERIINEINKKASYVLFLTDITNLSEEVVNKFKNINTNKSLVINKTDIFPKSLRKESVINYLRYLGINDKIIFTSAKKNIGIKEIINIINNYKNVYLIGYTNSGKSSLINRIKKELNFKTDITTSIIPNTTIDFIKIKLDDCLIVDSPGFTYENSIYNGNDLELIKKTDIKSSINPVTYQIKENDKLLIENYIEINATKKNSFTFYMSNDLNINKVYKESLSNLNSKEFEVFDNCDLIVKGLGFINIKKADTLKIYIDNPSLIEIRESIIGK